MLTKLKTVKILKNLAPLICNARLVNGVLNFCSGPGSPQLQAQVKISDNGSDHYKANLYSGDDYVVPAVADWVENHRVDDCGTVVSRKLSESAPCSGIDRISRILKNRFSSPDLVAQALSGCSVDLSDSLVEQLLKRYSNDCISAFGVFRWAQSQAGYTHSAGVYNAMIDVLGKAKEFQLVWELIGEMNQVGGCVSLVTFTSVIKMYAKAKRWKDVVDAFLRMEKHGINLDVSAMNIVLDVLAKENNVEFAQGVFLEFKSRISPDIRTFNILIKGWCKAKNVKAAWKTVEEMQEHGFDPNVVSYTNILDALCRDKEFCKAEAVLDTMQERGCTPNAVTYTVMMKGLGKAKQIDKAFEVYEKMKQNGCKPDSGFYSSLLQLLNSAGRFKHAEDILDDMKRQGLSPDVLNYNTMIYIACKHSQEETALKLLREMEEISCKPDLRTYGPLLKMCCKKKRMKVLSFLLGHMLKNDVSMDIVTYSLLVHGLCNSGKLEHACMFFEECVLKGMVPSDMTYKQLMKKLENSNMEEAKTLIEGLMSRARKLWEISVCQ